MLEDVKNSYIASADSVVPNWRKLSVNKLCNLYIENENDEVKKTGYFSAIVLKKWGYIGRHYNVSKKSGFTIEQCYDMILDGIMYILKKRKWLDPNNKLYGDASAPDKCLNRCISSARQRDFYLSNRDKRRTDFGKISLDQIIENVGDHSKALKEEDLGAEESNIDTKLIILDLFEKKKVLEALILDNIINDDCLTSKSSKVDGYKSNTEKFKVGKLINNLYSYNEEVIKHICGVYDVKENAVLDILPVLNKDKNKLSRIVKAVITKMSKDNSLRETLCQL